MDFLTYTERLAHTLKLIKKGSLESPSQLTNKFNISDKTARRMISSLKMQGYDIVYCRRKRKYFFRNTITVK